MQYGKVEICGVNTARLKLLSEEEKRELLNIIKNGTPAERKHARDEMINGNLRLVLSVIRRFAGRGENPDDLFQVGVIGLIKAIDNFDPKLDVRFSTYGVPTAYSSRNAVKYFYGGCKMSILSTVQAISLGIESIEAREDIPPKTKEQAIKLLKSLEQADWHRGWTKESILQALNDYRQRTGKAPTVTSLKEHGMPKDVTIRSVFQMSPSLLLKRMFPESGNQSLADRARSDQFGFETREDWIKCFREQFEKHKSEGMSCRRFNLLRDANTPAWETTARHCGISGWSELMKTAGVEYIKKKRQPAGRIVIADCKSPFLEKLEAANEKHECLLRKTIAVLSEQEQRRREWEKKLGIPLV